MYTITLPMSPQLRLFGLLLVGTSTILVLICPIVWPWRLLGTIFLLACGFWTWKRFLRRRPLQISVANDGRLSCICADGRTLEIARVVPGILHPNLVTARLESDAGEHCDLLVPGDGLSGENHWKLRCALIAFQPDRRGSRRGT